MLYGLSIAYHQVSRVELLDEVQVRAVNIANENNLTELPTLIFEFICTGKYVFSCDLLLVYAYSWIKSSILMEGI